MARKKHLAKTPLEVRAQALKPPTADRLCEIAEEIVDQLRPWKEREAAVVELVGMELHLVLCIAPLEATRCADLTVNRTHAQRHKADKEWSGRDNYPRLEASED